jgi:large subunit ribosomal protein L3
VMKRWGFKGGRKSHGATKHHRKGGSIGSVGPARVLKGKKMAGRLGATKVTAFNLQVRQPAPRSA